MRKALHTILLLVALGNINDVFAQLNAVTLIPPAGPGVNYSSITAAYTAIPAPVPGNYIIELQAAYTGSAEVYPITLAHKGMVNNSYTITIRPATGNNGEQIKRVIPAGGSIVSINGGDNIILDGRPGGVISSPQDYLTIYDPVIGNNTSRGVELLNGASNNVIQYVNAVAAESTFAGSRVISIGASDVAGNANNHIHHNIVTGGLRGIEVNGTVVPNAYNLIEFNEVKNFGRLGIIAGLFQDYTQIQSNTITNTSSNTDGTLSAITTQGNNTSTSIINNTINISLGAASPATTIYCIRSLVPASGVINIQGNTISNASSASQIVFGVFGIWHQGGSTINIVENTITNLQTRHFPSDGTYIEAISSQSFGTTTVSISRNKISNLISPGSIRGVFTDAAPGSVINVDNNFISITGNTTQSEFYGMLLLQSNPYTLNVYFNTVKIAAATTTSNPPAPAFSAGILLTGTNASATCNMKNNISLVELTGCLDTIVGFNNNLYAGALNSDYNIFYGSPNPNNNCFAARSGTNYFTNDQLVAYQATVSPNEANTKFTNVTFVSATDLHLSGASMTDMALKGIPVTTIAQDIDGQTRTTPYRGADEVPNNCITNNWTGSVNTAWENPGNWSCGTIPAFNTDVVIGPGFTVVLSSNSTIHSFTLNNSSHMTISSPYTLTILQ